MAETPICLASLRILASKLCTVVQDCAFEPGITGKIENWTNKAKWRRNSESTDCQRSRGGVRRTHSSECQAYPSQCEHSTAAAGTPADRLVLDLCFHVGRGNLRCVIAIAGKGNLAADER